MIDEKLTPAQKGVKTRAKNTYRFQQRILQENKMIDNAFVLRQSIVQSLNTDARDIDEECGYPLTIDVSDYQSRYNRNGIANRVVKLWPDECWNVVPEIVEDDETDETDFEQAWIDLEKKFSLNSRMYRLDVLSGIGHFGVMLIGINDGKTLDKPIEGIDLKTGEVKALLKFELIYARPLSESAIVVKETESDTSSPRYGLPKIYTLNHLNENENLSTINVDVHWTRVVHVADNKDVSDVLGVPRLQPVYNYILDIKKLIGSSAEMFWKGGFPGMAFEIDKERTAALTTDEKTALRTEFLDYTNKLQRYMALVGVTAKSLEVQVADPSNHFMIQLKAIGITLGVPYRKLLGSEEAKLASAEDSKTWSRRVTRRQNEYVTTEIVRSFINRLIQLGILPEPEYKNGIYKYDIKWPSLEELDPKDKTQIAKDMTEAIVKYVSGGADELIPPELFLTMILGFTDDEAESIMTEAEAWVDDHVDENEIAQAAAESAAAIKEANDRAAGINPPLKPQPGEKDE